MFHEIQIVVDGIEKKMPAHACTYASYLKQWQVFVTSIHLNRVIYGKYWQSVHIGISTDNLLGW